MGHEYCFLRLFLLFDSIAKQLLHARSHDSNRAVCCQNEAGGVIRNYGAREQCKGDAFALSSLPSRRLVGISIVGGTCRIRELRPMQRIPEYNQPARRNQCLPSNYRSTRVMEQLRQRTASSPPPARSVFQHLTLTKKLACFPRRPSINQIFFSFLLSRSVSKPKEYFRSCTKVISRNFPNDEIMLEESFIL